MDFDPRWTGEWWNQRDEERWNEEKLVFCSSAFDGASYIIPIENQPPVQCPYLLEHIISC
jgi:hypothetical protein